MSRTKLTRHTLRVIAFQSLFQMQHNEEVTLVEALTGSLSTHMEEDQEVEIDSLEELLEEYPQLAYSIKIIEGVKANQAEINESIAKYATTWTFDRIVNTDLLIMQLAIFEMNYLDEEVPKPVVLNEAIEIAKMYSDDKSAKFINGVLSNLV
ncbi:NusB antitermination factor [Granulicatella balaenopterae]|uniref:Transcription antitermination protein NusB n=1 Tax=Granulicatella balaenopterae TaxID=137733 RepID=A0A1H9GQ26_9LACT|nr:transcription antitermination factor NusB [Granulicatella balaenopterae]SEQ52205.1 NusB antitermination factor [Granulicatella balaenopterae]